MGSRLLELGRWRLLLELGRHRGAGGGPSSMATSTANPGVQSSSGAVRKNPLLCGASTACMRDRCGGTILLPCGDDVERMRRELGPSCGRRSAFGIAMRGGMPVVHTLAWAAWTAAERQPAGPVASAGTALPADNASPPTRVGLKIRGPANLAGAWSAQPVPASAGRILQGGNAAEIPTLTLTMLNPCLQLSIMFATQITAATHRRLHARGASQMCVDMRDCYCFDTVRVHSLAAIRTKNESVESFVIAR